MSRYFLGLTGASGHPYAERLIRALTGLGHEVDLALTGAGVKVLRHELGVRATPEGHLERAELERWLGPAAERVRVFGTGQVEAPASSGTSGTRAVILCPCSMGSLARVAAGFSSNLVERAADVALKERRKLVLVPRETPLSEIHLENLLRMARLGAVVLPAMPGFYHAPKDMDDLIDHVISKVLDALGLEYERGVRWTGELEGDPGATPPGREG